MKRFILLFILFLVVGCSGEEDSSLESDDNYLDEYDDVVEDVSEDVVVDEVSIDVGLYIYTDSYTPRVLTSEYTTEWILNVDLCSLEVYYTSDEEISGSNQKSVWKEYFDNYNDIDGYRIGYKIEFSTTDGDISQTILSPDDTVSVYDYMQIYMYDDINQELTWYSHITEDEFDDSSLLSSIKLTGSGKTDSITSDITLTTFVYDSFGNSFDDNGEYIGNNTFTTVIKKEV